MMGLRLINLNLDGLAKASGDHSMNRPGVAIIVVGWNNRDLLPATLDSVRAQDYPAEDMWTYVVDNGSEDDSVAMLQQDYSWVNVIETGWNSGFAFANNRGIERASAEHNVQYVVLLNSDATLDSNWLSTLVAFAETRPRGACFQSVTVDARQPDRMDSTHLWVGTDLQARQSGYGDRTRPVPTRRVFGVNAAAALYSTRFFAAQPFDQVLDERMWMYLEDVDLSFRALVMGWENWTVTGTTAQHLGSVSTNSRASGFALRQTCRNQPILWITHLPWRTMLRSLPAVIRHDRGAIRHLRVTGSPEAIPALIKGRLAGIGQIPYALRRRAALRATTRLLDDDAIRPFMVTGTLGG
jgi:GT2 family glycosyltransferase